MSNVIERIVAPRTTIRNALEATCNRLKLGEAHLRAIIEMALSERAIRSLSTAATVEHGFRLAEKMASNLKPRREQLRMKIDGAA